MREVSLMLLVENQADCQLILPKEIQSSRFQSSAISGEVVDAGVLVTITLSSLKIFFDFATSYINRNNSITIKYRGIEISAQNSNDLQKIIDKMNQDLSDDK